MEPNMTKLKGETDSQHSDGTFIIGIGASAGGLAPIYQLFENPSPPNTTFIVIQHLPPDFKSNTASLLANHTNREIKQISNNLLIEPNSIYVMTERKSVTIKDGRFVTNADKAIHSTDTVDLFLKSLAEYKGSRSGAIILSGANSDGTKGAQAIKEAGGFVIVQDPSTAQFNMMPNSIINAGLSDSIAAPDVIMSQLDKHIRQNEIINQLNDNNEFILNQILNLISSHTPLDFSNYKRTTIVRRITRRMNNLGLQLATEYIHYLKENPEEIEVLSKEFMISVTRFFRDPQAFEMIKDKVIPDLVLNKLKDRTLKIWIVGCATGEEAYSLAILIYEYLETIKERFEVKIFATDIDQKALAIASKGIYRNIIEDDVSVERLSRYFFKENKQYRIREEIRSMLIFAQHDITKNPPYYKLDLISCRNVLIYLNPLLQKKILSTMHFCLNLGGYLFLGPSESLGDLKTLMLEVDKKWKIYKNMEAGKLPENEKYTTSKYSLNPYFNQSSSVTTNKIGNHSNLPDLISNLLLNEFGSAGICVDENLKITQTYGNFDKYLLPERFNFNLLEMLPKELSIACGISLRKSLKENIDTEVKGVLFEEKGLLRSVNVLIKPVNSNTSEKNILVLFSENRMNDQDTNTIEVYHKEIHSNRYIQDLEAELKDLKEEIRETREELELSRNNAQAYNEELISGNEELQSTNEEVQSVNEELQTVNNQYQLKIKELAELNDDLNNYFRSTQNAQIYIDKDLIIRKYTPPAMTQVNIKENDIGRPITDISTNIKFSTFIEDIKKAISTGAVMEKEVQTTDKKWYQMMLMPYLRFQDNQVNGVVITFNDVTELKKSQMNLMKINEDHNTFIYSVSHDLNSPISNISGIISVLDNVIDPTNKKLKELIDLLTVSINKLKETVIELSDITKIEKESSEEIHEAINLNELLQEIEVSVRDLLLQSKAKINVDLKEPSIRFSKKNLRSILLNLLTNAIKYRSPQRDLEITITTERKGNYIILLVEDNGMGINAEKKSKLFSKFERLHETAEITGTGIGLYLIKKIISNAEGNIKVESEEGKGSRFIVSFKS